MRKEFFGRMEQSPGSSSMHRIGSRRARGDRRADGRYAGRVRRPARGHGDGHGDLQGRWRRGLEAEIVVGRSLHEPRRASRSHLRHGVHDECSDHPRALHDQDVQRQRAARADVAGAAVVRLRLQGRRVASAKHARPSPARPGKARITVNVGRAGAAGCLVAFRQPPLAARTAGVVLRSDAARSRLPPQPYPARPSDAAPSGRPVVPPPVVPPVAPPPRLRRTCTSRLSAISIRRPHRATPRGRRRRPPARTSSSASATTSTRPDRSPTTTPTSTRTGDRSSRRSTPCSRRRTTRTGEAIR